MNSDAFSECAIITDVRHTVKEIRASLRRLDGEPADAIESETVECKPWLPDSKRLKEQLRDLRETVVCLTNARGGTIVLGIQDGKRTRREAIEGVGGLNPDTLRRAVFDGTEPHVTVEIEELREPEGRLLLIQVPRGVTPHTTSEGVGKIRVGKECKPLTGPQLARLVLAGGEMDLTAQPIEAAAPSDLDPDQVKKLRGLVAAAGGGAEFAKLAPEEFLEGVGLVRDGDVTLAAILLLGRPAAIARWAAQHEVIFIRYETQTRYDVRKNLRGPILEVLDVLQRQLEAHLKVALIEAGGLGEIAAPDVTWWTAREAILNALAHRDYFLLQAVYVEIRPGRLEISSPGGFIGGVTAENIVHHPPARRNRLLAEILERAGFVNRAGMGVDRMYEELLRLGKPMPRYEADEASVRLVLATKSHPEFARHVAGEMRGGRSLELDDLIVLRAVVDQGHLDRWSAAKHLQRSQDDAAGRLVALRERGYLLPQGRGRGTIYRLTPALSDELRGRLATDETIALDDEAIRLRIQAVLGERGRLNNAEVRRLSGYSRAGALRLMRRLQQEGLAVVQGRGRGAFYAPGAKLVKPIGKDRSGRRSRRG